MSIISKVFSHFTPFKSEEALWHGSLDEKKQQEPIRTNEVKKEKSSSAKPTKEIKNEKP